MGERIAIIGLGPVGRAAAELALKQGRAVTVAQRQRPTDLPAGASFVACDVNDADSVRGAARGAAQVVLAIGLPYVGKVWRETWPRAMANVVAACEAEAARLVFVDNLYMHGPQTAPLVETMPLADHGVKPAVRAEVTRIWMREAEAGRLKFAALRAPDFYGPGVGNSHLGDTAIGALTRGKAALVVGSPDTPHDFTYVPDFGRAVVTLLDAPDSAYGQAWNVPSAPTETPRRILEIAAAALGVPLRVRGLPLWALGPLGLVTPMLGELAEMRFQWDRPYRVDAGKFAATFWSDATPFAIGVRATALACRAAAVAAA